MRKLSDEALMDSYYEANKLLLEEEFIALLLEEINRRGIDVDSVRKKHLVLNREISIDS
ncbi:sporulation histidine kinase inhibitor Sda [Cohnella sp. NL03-T5]|uniref:Sporulation histidine kinase inhibitor Sda n=1 Tax=Cohnella silvisoli TaxID=2873699 RepID=A0ABV1KXS2_9BACL|nr:sporulation histidine kinase inhibitor Sda [Cohnella silvisoli]